MQSSPRLVSKFKDSKISVLTDVQSVKKPLLASALLFAVALAAGGCNSSGTQSFNEAISSEEGRRNMDERYAAMVDNAMLHDLSLADIHFAPHTSELNTLGKNRLERYARLLSTRGGTLYLESALQDEEFNNSRLQNVMDSLASAGIDGDRMKVEMGVRAGRGISATEAIDVKEPAFKAEERRGDLTDIIGGGLGAD